MWFIFGIIAIIFTTSNIVLFLLKKDYKFTMVLGLSFTALTLCAKYSQTSKWVKVEDWGALSDVVPTMEVALWTLTLSSILLNLTPIVLDLLKKKKEGKASEIVNKQ